MSRVLSGLDVLVRRDFASLRGKRLGVLCHPASVDIFLRHILDIFFSAGLNVRAIFGPQHGLFGETQDNMIEWSGFVHPRYGMPVHSLYGDVRKPTAEMLDGLDTVVIDLQDVGARYYTFVWTAVLMMQSCAEAGVELIVFDRPNPIGGHIIEGPMLDNGLRSFVGLYSVPVRHSLTIGELLRYLKARAAPTAHLTVIPMEGWRREMWFDQTKLPWVMPSPNIPSLDTASVYPGQCLLEGTNISEGRGTTRPFEIFGAPFIDPYALVERLESFGLEGVVFRPLYFVPTFHKHTGETVGGAQIHITDRERFRPVLTSLALLETVIELYPDDFAYREPPYEYDTEHLPIEILLGDKELLGILKGGASIRDISEQMGKGVGEFASAAANAMLYSYRER